MENDIKKNACQKDIKERSMLYWNKMEKELKNLYPLAFDRDHFFKVEVDEMKLVLSEIEKSGTKFDKDDCLKSVNCFKTRLYCVPLDSCNKKILEKRKIYQFLGKKRALSELRFEIYWHSPSYFLDFPNVISLRFADKD